MGWPNFRGPTPWQEFHGCNRHLGVVQLAHTDAHWLKRKCSYFLTEQAYLQDGLQHA